MWKVWKEGNAGGGVSIFNYGNFEAAFCEGRAIHNREPEEKDQG